MRIQYTITGPKGTADVSYVADVEGGAVRAVAPGEDLEADLLLTVGRADMAAVVDGTADPDALFMQGRIKVVGSMGRYVELVPDHGAPHRALLAGVAAQLDA
jgi:putative sterol carrier protein